MVLILWYQRRYNVVHIARRCKLTTELSQSCVFAGSPLVKKLKKYGLLWTNIKHFLEVMQMSRTEKLH